MEGADGMENGVVVGWSGEKMDGTEEVGDGGN